MTTQKMEESRLQEIVSIFGEGEIGTMARELLSLRSIPSGGAVKVRELEWRSVTPKLRLSYGGLLNYAVRCVTQEDIDYWRWEREGRPPSNPFPTAGEAEAAVHEHYTQRILSALEPAEQGGGEPLLTGRGWENLSCDDQYALARQIAANIGYELVAEAEHPDSPHNRAHALHQGNDEPGKYDDVLVPFIQMMEGELHANAGKGDRPGWLAMSREEVLLEIYHHLAKLQKAVRNNDIAGVREFAADVANMSMMAVDICGAWPPTNTRPASPPPVPVTEISEGMVERAAPIIAFRTPEAWEKENDQFKGYYRKQARDFLTAALLSSVNDEEGGGK